MAKHNYKATSRRLGVRDPVKYCPFCGSNRSFRSLILCNSCWQQVPGHIQAEAMKAAKEDRDSLVVGKTAARVIASIPKELDEAA